MPYFCRFLIVLLLIAGSFVVQSPTQAQQDGCAVDLMLVLDGSGSIAPQDFTLMKTFVYDFVKSFPVGSSGANIGIIQFSDTAELYLEITNDQDEILTSINHMTQFGNRTDIAGAINLAQSQFAVRREGIPRVIIVLTDGMHNMGGNPIAQADIARANGTNVFGIGVGSFDLSELISISGGEANVISVGSFEGLNIIIDTLLNTTCTAPLVPPVSNVNPNATVAVAATPTPRPSEPTATPGSVTVVITPTAAPGSSTAPTTVPPIAAPGPRDTQIAFSSNRDGDFEIFVMDGDGGNVRQLTFNTADDNKPAWSKDGRMLAWESNVDGDWDIWVMNSDGSNQQNLTSNDIGDWGPAWSPDNSRIAFHSNRVGGTAIWVMNADGSSPVQITNSSGIDQAGTWSPDGQEIIYMSDKSGGRELYRYNLRTNTETRLTDNQYYDGFADWSFNGTQVVFGSARADANSELWVMRADGTNVTRLTNRTGTDDDPVWSPDSRQIAFESDATGNYEIWVMNADGSGLQQLTNDPAMDWSADWIWKP